MKKSKSKNVKNVKRAVKKAKTVDPRKFELNAEAKFRVKLNELRMTANDPRVVRLSEVLLDP